MKHLRTIEHSRPRAKLFLDHKFTLSLAALFPDPRR